MRCSVAALAPALLAVSLLLPSCGDDAPPAVLPPGDGFTQDASAPDLALPDLRAPDVRSPDSCAQVTWYKDADGDKYGVTTSTIRACRQPSGYAAVGGDCDDANASVNPGAKEICNKVDDNCNSFVDEGLPLGVYFKDSDGDGYGGTSLVQACQAPAGFVQNTGDCNDNNKDIYPGATEQCNKIDDNCNGAVDEGLQKSVFYQDMDSDGYGGAAAVQDCQQPSGFVGVGGDCNDANQAVHPGATETCNELDDNCNGTIDEGLQKGIYFLDADGDGYGGVAFKTACSAPSGYVTKGGDCNDNNKDIHPGAAEQCNKVDDDCNGYIDDNLSQLTVYRDNDGDGYAKKGAATQQVCQVPAGWALPRDADGDGSYDWDCDDSASTAYPGAPTKCGDGKDNDCDGTVDRLCFSPCAGKWQTAPFKLQYAYGTVAAPVADLDGDGLYEVIVHDGFGFAVLDAQGNALHQYSKQNYNFSRGLAVLADVDDYDTFGVATQTMEILTANGSVPRFYKKSGTTVAELTGTDPMYDASKLMARDIDGDGQVELFATSWCKASEGVLVFRYDKKSAKIIKALAIPDPDGTCQYTNARLLADLDGDDQPELLFVNGYARNYAPTTWSGKVYALAFSNTKTLATQAYCSGASCFGTAVSGLYPATSYWLMALGGEVRGQVLYFTSNTPNNANSGTYRYWHWGLKGQVLPGSPSTGNTLWADTTDIDRDGKAESYGYYVAYLGLYDVNGDTYPDRVYHSGNELRLWLWDPKQNTFVENQGSRTKVTASSVVVRSMWDMDGDGRLEVIASDAQGAVHCYQMGKNTWSRQDALPPHFTMFQRTYQWDNYEPNDGDDPNKDGIPDQVVRVPSALTSKGDFYSYISGPKDEDYFLVNTAWGGQICLTAPRGKTYVLSVYSFADKWNNTTQSAGADGKADGLLWQKSTPKGGQVCFTGTSVLPPRYGEYKFVVRVQGFGGDYSPHWPYWIWSKK